MVIMPLVHQDAAWAAEMLRDANARGELLYAPMTAERFAARLMGEGSVGFAAREDDRPIGFVLGAIKRKLLPGENASALYLTLILVEPGSRGRGVGNALLGVLGHAAQTSGKTRLVVSGDSPIHMTWQIPETHGHDHNNAPGVWEDGDGYAYLLHRGFAQDAHEVAMYRALSDYTPSPERAERVKALGALGIRVGRWQIGLGDQYDGMCDRVGSEYWRSVLREELAAWRENRPNADPELWADGKRPAGPRTLLTATRKEYIIGFTGPVDLQESGRGWFTGICTDPIWSGNGIASVLFDMLLEAFWQEGAAFCSLFTGADNPARRIYLRAGLRVAARFCAMSLPL